MLALAGVGVVASAMIMAEATMAVVVEKRILGVQRWSAKVREKEKRKKTKTKTKNKNKHF